MSNVEYCILTDEKDIIKYEKGLYKAYSIKDPLGWIFNNYIKNNNTLRSKINYSDLIIYALKDQDINKIIGGSAINYNIKKNAA